MEPTLFVNRDVMYVNAPLATCIPWFNKCNTKATLDNLFFKKNLLHCLVQNPLLVPNGVLLGMVVFYYTKGNPLKERCPLEWEQSCPSSMLIPFKSPWWAPWLFQFSYFVRKENTATPARLHGQVFHGG